MLATRTVSKSLPAILCKSCTLGSAFSNQISVRTALKSNRHWNPKWKKLRGLKVIKVDLPDYNKKSKPIEEMTSEEMRSFCKEEGIQPHRPWYDRDFNIYSTSDVFEPYVPPEGDGKLSPLNSAGAKQKLEWLKKKGRSWKDLRTIRKFDEDFELYPDFVDKAQQVYINAHTALMNKDDQNLIKFVTEKAFPEMLFNAQLKTIRWKFLESIEPPRVSHIRCTKIMSDEHTFAQLTVRFHTKQCLAIYDRFGRLIYGSESISKDVLEYVVFEKQVSNEYGDWRVHAKIIPDWLQPKDLAPRTYALSDKEKEAIEEKAQEPDAVERAAPKVNVPTVIGG